MESAGNLFFHLLCGAILFITAAFCLVIGIRGVHASVTICRTYLNDEVVYETVEIVEERLVSGEYVVACLMTELQHAVCIEQGDSAVEIPASGNSTQRLEELEISPDAVLRVSYVYGIYGDIQQVCFTEVIE